MQGRLTGWVAAAGRNSYGLFLLHWPLLLTITCGLFVMIEPHLGFGPAVMLALLASMPVLAASVLLFSRYVERPVIGALRCMAGRQTHRRPAI
jgi:peptidoglycan/LPS O-acetylase OafA/YrhL